MTRVGRGVTPEYRRCAHGLFRLGWCFSCFPVTRSEQRRDRRAADGSLRRPSLLRRLDGWLARHDRTLTRLGAAFLFITALYFVGSVALR